ncbi:MAG: protein-L-isoaspartate(D-aspartate) O-methyltransferase [Nitrospirae bacterium]|nr:protein-L-isoaspartate(D-aspartate) O-methyltransferase [Nitrospirota bacterium]
MVDEQLVARGIGDSRVLAAMAEVPRHLFVESALADRAYEDRALPIGGQQTISQPYMVALMSQALELNGSERVLEVGTGSGYQAAVLARLAARIFTMERVKPLADRARNTFERLKVYNVVVRQFDGTFGWPEEAPFDAILVAAGAPAVPEPLIGQLREGGRLIVPVGDRTGQRLQKVVKRGGAVCVTELMECAFVPLIGSHGWRSARDSPSSPAAIRDQTP